MYPFLLIKKGTSNVNNTATIFFLRIMEDLHIYSNNQNYLEQIGQAALEQATIPSNWHAFHRICTHRHSNCHPKYLLRTANCNYRV